MCRIYLYELKRLITNRFFLLLLLAACGYGYQFLRGSVILGAAGTAPFSPWSYGMFLSGVLPIPLISLMFLISFLYGERERRVRFLTGSTQTGAVRLTALKLGAVLTGFAIIWACVVAVSFVFYAVVFRYTGFATFAAPLLLACVPPLLFWLGLGLAAGHIHPGLLYASMPILLLLGQGMLPDPPDLLGGRFFQEYPLTAGLPVDFLGEIVFAVPAAVLAQKAALGLIGLILAWAGLKWNKKPVG